MVRVLAIMRRPLKSRKWQRSPEPTPPPPPEHWGEGLLICVKIRRVSEETATFLRFKIPAHTTNHLLNVVNSDSSKVIVRYVRHSHHNNSDGERFFEYSLEPELNGPFSSDLSCYCASSVIGSVVYCLNNNCDDANVSGDCHSVRYCDFDQKVPQWKICKPLTWHRFNPTMVTVSDKLYVFERNADLELNYGPSKMIPLALLFDPSAESCKAIPFSSFHKEGFCDLVVASIGQKLLVLDEKSKSQYYYNTETLDWIPFDCEVLAHVSDIRTQLVPVVESCIIYWLDADGCITAFDWENLKIFKGPIIGFSHEYIPENASRSCMSLLHLKHDLFCLVWSDWHDPSNMLHLTVLRICLDDVLDTSPFSDTHLTIFASHPLTATVVACFCYHLNFKSVILGTHLLLMHAGFGCGNEWRAPCR